MAHAAQYLGKLAHIMLEFLSKTIVSSLAFGFFHPGLAGFSSSHISGKIVISYAFVLTLIE